MINNLEIKQLLDTKEEQYNKESFIASDPISIPHQFQRKEDIEITAFLVAIISWGSRKSIIKNGQLLVDLMNGTPYNFIMERDHLLTEYDFVHRTFNGQDLAFFMYSLQHIYKNNGGLENVFDPTANAYQRILRFRSIFLGLDHLQRTEKHIANPMKGSCAKRINMFLRWMIRQDKKGVDFGLWKNHSMSSLYVPLDIHTGSSARKLGLIGRKANDWKALEELMVHLRQFSPSDPCKYDYALFGLSAHKEI